MDARVRLGLCTSECLLHAGGPEASAQALAAADAAVQLALLAAPGELPAAHCQVARCHWAQRGAAQQAEGSYHQALEAAQQAQRPYLPAVLGLAALLAQSGRAGEVQPLLQQAQQQLAAATAGGPEAGDAASRASGDVGGWTELLLLRQAGTLSVLGELEGAKAAALAAEEVAVRRGEPMQVSTAVLGELINL